jgi:hypothetical protein
LFNFNFRSPLLKKPSGLLALFTFTILFVTGLANQAKAADLSGAIETGGAVAGTAATIDTFLIDVNNDGNGATAAITLGTGNAGLTVSSDGFDANDVGQILSFTSTDNTGTANPTLNDSTDGTSDLRLQVNGNISGDVATDANDLNITIDSSISNGGRSQLQVTGDITLGTGTVTLNSGSGSSANLVMLGTGAQAVNGLINGAATGEGQVFNDNTGGTVTYNSNIGSGLSVDRVRLSASTTTVFNGSVSAATDINLKPFLYKITQYYPHSRDISANF